MNVKELKKQLDNLPENMDLYVNVEFVEEEDCGKLPLISIHLSIDTVGVKAILEYEGPYM